MPEKPKKKNALGFPPPLLGEQPFRLHLLAAEDAWIALDKPSDVGTRAYPWDTTPDLDTALNLQLEAGKPELQRTGASLFGSVYYLDPAISGVALFAKSKAALSDLRNSFGSGDCRFTFHFVSSSASAGASDTTQNAVALADEFQADAPLLPHNIKPKMIPSSAKGKKCFTRFQRLADSDLGWTLWQAEADFFRPHQVRAHAATHGIPVLGDELYGGPAAPTVRQIQPRARRSDLAAPVYKGSAVHLSKAQFPAGEGSKLIESPYPKPLALLLKRLSLG